MLIHLVLVCLGLMRLLLSAIMLLQGCSRSIIRGTGLMVG